jgi:hypothetical protein
MRAAPYGPRDPKMKSLRWIVVATPCLASAPAAFAACKIRQVGPTASWYWPKSTRCSSRITAARFFSLLSLSRRRKTTRTQSRKACQHKRRLLRLINEHRRPRAARPRRAHRRLAPLSRRSPCGAYHLFVHAWPFSNSQLFAELTRQFDAPTATSCGHKDP